MSGEAKGTAAGAGYVRQMFGRIAPRYDLLNHVLSLEVDRWWRRRVAGNFRGILGRPGARVLDLCCGTGDLALALAGRASASARIVGADFCHPMLERAQAKFLRRGLPPLLAEADALGMPFASASFDLVAAAFGFRNLADYPGGLREIYRVLKPGGQAGILEFSDPQAPLFASLYGFYFRHILPRVGGVVSGDRRAYQYLNHSVGDFPPPARLAEMMCQAGFSGVRFQRFSGGVAYLHIGRKC